MIVLLIPVFLISTPKMTERLGLDLLCTTQTSRDCPSQAQLSTPFLSFFFAGFTVFGGYFYSNECRCNNIYFHSLCGFGRYNVKDHTWTNLSDVPDRDKKGVLVAANGKVFSLSKYF